jgi:purine-nucleoside phosphorylase
LYEGYEPAQVEFPVQVLAALGVRVLVVTNAAGGLNPLFRCGDLVVLDDLVDLTFARADHFTRGDERLPWAGGSLRFSSDLAARAWKYGRRAGVGVHRGTYVGVTGPNYETRAEYRFLRRVGDVVGMSTVHEVAAACRLGMQVLGLSVVTNECCPENLARTTGESVVRAVEAASGRLARLIHETLRDILREL